jgi:RNA-directed DNA polymerase
MVGRMHQPIPGQGEWLRGVVCGWFAYHAVPTNTRSLQTLRDCAILLWLRSLWRRLITNHQFRNIAGRQGLLR